jgi:hypothetical protein
MTPKEAGAIDFEEPDWRARFAAHGGDSPQWFAQERAFEAVLREWRRFHFIWVELERKAKRQPASAPEGIVALAQLGIMPPRFTVKDVPRTDETGFQCDDHMWLSIAGEQWRIAAVEDRILCLERGFDDKPETRQINLATAKWQKHIQAALDVLKAAWPELDIPA